MYKLQFCTFIFAVLLQSGFGYIKLQRYWGSRLWPFGSRDVIGHVITGFPMCCFLLDVNMNLLCISHGCRDIELQRYLDQALNPLTCYRWIRHEPQLYFETKWLVQWLTNIEKANCTRTMRQPTGLAVEIIIYSTLALVLPISTVVRLEWYNGSITPRVQSGVNKRIECRLHYRTSATVE